MLYPLSYEGGGRKQQRLESSVWPSRSHFDQLPVGTVVENCRSRTVGGEALFARPEWMPCLIRCPSLLTYLLQCSPR